MSDDRLALVAEVVDKFSGPLANLRKQLGDVRSTPHMAAMKRDFVEVEGGIGKAAATIRNQLSPALAAMGISSLGATIGIAGIGTAVAGMVTGAADIRRFAGEVGLTVDKLRELNGVGQRFGIDPSQMQNGLRQLQGAAEDFRKHGALYTDTMARFPTLGNALVNSKSFGEFADNAIREIMRIPNAAIRAEEMTKFFGTNLFAGVSSAERMQALDAVRKNIAQMPKDVGQAAEELRQRMHGIREQLEAFKDQAVAPLIPKIEEFVRGLTSVGTVDITNPQLNATLAEIKGWVDGIKWEEVGKDFGKEMLEALRTVKRNLEDVNELVQIFRNLENANKQSGADFNRDVLGGFNGREWLKNKATAGPNSPGLSGFGYRLLFGDEENPNSTTSFANKHPRVPEGANEERARRAQEAVRSAAPERPVMPDVPRPKLPTTDAPPPPSLPAPPSDPSAADRRAEQIKAKIAELEARRADTDKVPAVRLPERQAELGRQIQALTEELKRLRESAGATVQQQSFDGSSPFGEAKLQNAAWGGLPFRRPAGMSRPEVLDNLPPRPSLDGLREGQDAPERPDRPEAPKGLPRRPQTARPRLPNIGRERDDLSPVPERPHMARPRLPSARGEADGSRPETPDERPRVPVGPRPRLPELPPVGMRGAYRAPRSGEGQDDGRPLPPDRLRVPNIGPRPSVPDIGARPTLPGLGERPKSPLRGGRDLARERIRSWMEFLTKPVEEGGLGRARHQAEGEVASLLGESPGLDPNRTHDHGTGYGTAAWRDPKGWGDPNGRRTALFDFAKGRGLDPHSVAGQQEFYRHEMLGKFRDASDAIARAQTREDALREHVYKFEKPANKPGEAAGRRRNFGAIERALKDSGPNSDLAERPTRPNLDFGSREGQRPGPGQGLERSDDQIIADMKRDAKTPGNRDRIDTFAWMRKNHPYGFGYAEDEAQPDRPHPGTGNYRGGYKLPTPPQWFQDSIEKGRFGYLGKFPDNMPDEYKPKEPIDLFDLKRKYAPGGNAFDQDFRRDSLPMDRTPTLKLDPGVELLRKALKPAASDGPTSSDWFGRAMDQTGSSPQKVEGSADLKVRFEGLPRGSKIDHSTEGLFKSIQIDRGRSMQAPQDV